MKWFVRHNRLITYGSYILVAIALVVAILNNFYTTLVAIACAGFLLLLTVISVIAQNKAIKGAKEILESRCDPQEYLEVCGSLYKTNSKLPLRIINYCNALTLSSLSNYKIVRKALEQIEKSHTAITSKYVEALFYVSLCDISIHFDEFRNAEIYYKKAYTAYEGIKNEEQINEIKDMLLICLVELLINKGDFERAQRENNNIEEKSKRKKLQKLYLSAKIDLAQGNEEKARASLEVVASNANKLSLVEKAEILLGNAEAKDNEE